MLWQFILCSCHIAMLQPPLPPFTGCLPELFNVNLWGYSRFRVGEVLEGTLHTSPFDFSPKFCRCHDGSMSTQFELVSIFPTREIGVPICTWIHICHNSFAVFGLGVLLHGRSIPFIYRFVRCILTGNPSRVTKWTASNTDFADWLQSIWTLDWLQSRVKAPYKREAKEN